MHAIKKTWREQFAESSISLCISTVIHTAAIILLAFCVTLETPTNSTSIIASLEPTTEALLELCSTSEFSDTLGEYGESAPPDTEEHLQGLDVASLSDPDVDVQLKDVRPTRIQPNPNATSRLIERPVKVTSRKLSNAATLASARTNQQSTISFGGKNTPGGRQIGIGRASTLEVIVPGLDATGSSVLNQASNLSLTGGAMMVSTARPDAALVKVPLRFEYDATRPDGTRFVITADNQRVIHPMYDWELMPLSKFVDAGHHGAISIHLRGNSETVSLDAAFENTLLGLRFVQADMMPRGLIMSQEFLPQDENGIIVGPGEAERLSPDEVVAAAVKELRPLMAKTVHGASFSVLTDASKPFVYSIEGDELVIKGSPYFFFWEPANKGDQVIPRKALNESLKKAWHQIKEANPLVIESMERCFRVVAFFRYQKKTSPDNWEKFVEQLKVVSLPYIPTPTVMMAK